MSAATNTADSSKSAASRIVASVLSARGMLAVLVGEVLVFWALNPDFVKLDNVRNILVQSVFVLLLACGMTLVLITGGIDLSVGGVLGMGAGVTMFLLVRGQSIIVAMLGGLAAGLLVGVVNGLVVTKVRINDFIVTLATMSMAFGVLKILDSVRPLRVTEAGVSADTFSWLGGGFVAGIPVPLIVGLIVVVILEVTLKYTSFGRSIYSTGVNRAAAHLCGIRVDRTRIIVFMISGLIAGLAGVLMASRLGSAQTGLGTGYELQAIAAAVIGGTALAGGRGDVLGAVIGSLILGILSNGLQLANVDPAWFQVVVGLSIIGAMLANDGLRRLAVGLNMRATRLEGAADLQRASLRDFLILEGGVSVPDLLDMRITLEGQAARLAAERATDGEVEDLGQVVSRMEENGVSNEEFVNLDSRLHLSIVQAAKNPLLVYQYESVRNLFVDYSMRVLDIPSRRAIARVGHEQLLDAIRAHDQRRAEEAATEHLEAVKRDLAGYVAPVGSDEALGDLQAAAAGEV